MKEIKIERCVIRIINEPKDLKQNLIKFIQQAERERHEKKKIKKAV